MKTLKRLGSLLLVALLAGACAPRHGRYSQINVPTDPNLSRIGSGTDALAVQAELGMPEFVVELAGGGYEATYKYSVGYGARWVTVIFDEQGRVVRRLGPLGAHEAARVAESGIEPFMGWESWGRPNARDTWFELLHARNLIAEGRDPARDARLSRHAGMTRGELEDNLNGLAAHMQLPARLLHSPSGDEESGCCYVEFARPGGVEISGGAWRAELTRDQARALTGVKSYVGVSYSVSEDWSVTIADATLYDRERPGSYPMVAAKTPGSDEAETPEAAPAPRRFTAEEEQTRRKRPPPHLFEINGEPYEREFGLGLSIGVGGFTGRLGEGFLGSVGAGDDNGTAGLYLAGHAVYRPERWLSLSFVTEWEREDIDLLGADFGRFDIVSLSGEVKARTTLAEPAALFLRMGGGWNVNLWSESAAGCAAWGTCTLTATDAPLLRVAGGVEFVTEEAEFGMELGWKWNDAEARMNLGGSPLRDDLELSSFYASFRYIRFLEW